jgi:hypothetical protein
MPGDVSFWPENHWGLMMTGQAGRGREQGPSGPETHPTLVYAEADVFVVAPGQGGYVLHREGDLIRPPYDQLPRVPAVWVGDVLVPGT